jgi:hypothetical protein
MIKALEGLSSGRFAQIRPRGDFLWRYAAARRDRHTDRFEIEPQPGGAAGAAESFVLVLIGVVAATRTAKSLVYGTQATDPAVMELAVPLLIAIAAAASFVPALRAARLEPVAALREE